MKKKILVLSNAVLTSLLGLCGCEDGLFGDRCLYGSPEPDDSFLFGTVLNEQDDPVVDIQVVVEGDTVYSSETGRFVSHRLNGNPWDSVQVTVNDVDGEANGSYENLSVRVRPVDSPVQITLKEKNKEQICR